MLKKILIFVAVAVFLVAAIVLKTNNDFDTKLIKPILADPTP